MSKSLEWWQIPPQKFIFLQNKKKHKLQHAGPAAQEWGWPGSPTAPGHCHGAPTGDVWGQPPSFHPNIGAFPPKLAKWLKARGRCLGAHPGDRSLTLPHPVLSKSLAPPPVFWENIFLSCKAVAGAENGRALGNPSGLRCFGSNSHLTWQRAKLILHMTDFHTFNKKQFLSP